MPTERLDEYVCRGLADHASRTAIVDGARIVSYGDLDRRSAALAAALAAAGCLPGDRVAILLHNSVEFIESEIAVLRAGLVKVPLNNRLSAPEIAAQLADCGAKLLIAEPEFVPAVAAGRAALPALREIVCRNAVPGAVAYDSFAGRAHPPFAPPPRKGDDVCLIRYSGGTTGRAKGIMHTHASLVAIARAVVSEYRIGPHTRFLHVAHLSHGQNFVWPALIASGARLVMMRRFEPSEVLAAIAREGITRLHLVPTMAMALLDAPDFAAHDLSSLEDFVYASAPMPVERVRRLRRALPCRIAQTYTLSESAVVSTVLSAEDHDTDRPDFNEARLASCGRPAAGVSLRIVDDAFADVAPGEVGEIALLSAGNMAGYWNQPELTARVLRDGWVLTGDLGRCDADGYLYLVDRKDDKIITGALNVYPREVEEVLHQHPDVKEAAVAGIPDERWGEAIAAFVVLRPNAGVTADALSEFCAAKLAGYKKPKRYFFVDALPRTAIGKISRRSLANPFWEGKARRIN